MGLKLLFTAAEDAALWRFAIEDHEGYGKCNIWELFKEKSGSPRPASGLQSRLTSRLIPHLHNTKFHAENKLKLCKKYRVPISGKFLEELSKYADIDLNSRGVVVWYQLKPDCPENKDMELDDEKFMELTSPIVSKVKMFTPEEDAVLWDHVIRNYKTYSRGAEVFWTEVSKKLGSHRLRNTLSLRFLRLAPKLHLQNCDIEVKLELYKKTQVIVSRSYLATLREHAELELDAYGCIADYKLKANRPEKRKMSDGSDGNQKKARVDEDMILDDFVVGNDVPDMPREELNADNQLADSDLNSILLNFFKTEIIDDIKIEEPDPEENPKESIETMMDAMKKMEKRMDNQGTAFTNHIKNHKVSCDKKITEMSKKMDLVQNEMKVLRAMVRPDDVTDSKKQCLLKFKSFVSSLHSPEMNDLENRIDTAIQNLPDSDEKPKFADGLLKDVLDIVFSLINK